MNIIIEGADNSGKSTLVNYLAAVTGYSYVPGEGPPKSTTEINERAARYLKMDNCIFDRHPCVSNAFYDRHRDVSMPVSGAIIHDFLKSNPLLIYCAHDGSLDTHVVKEHETQAHVGMVEKHRFEIQYAYDQWALENANWIYRKGRTDMANIAFMIKAIERQHGTGADLVGDVAEFHHKFNLPLERPVVGMLSEEISKFRMKFLREELNEYHDARSSIVLMMNASERHHDREEYTDLLEQQLDALVDLVYVAIGTALFHGFDFRTAWKRVQEANMAKVRAAPDGSNSKRGSSFDVVKPEGWQAPSHTDLVANNDFEQVFPDA